MNIPKQAKQVFKGVIFDVFQWPQKMYNGSTVTFERAKRKYTVQVIASTENKIILGDEKQPSKKREINILGGRLEKNESPLTCAKRELLEEGGYVSKNWSLFKIYDDVPKLDWKVYFFIATDCKKITKQNLDSGEKISIITVSFDQFIKMIEDKKIFTGQLGFDILKMKLDGKLNQFKNKLFTSNKQNKQIRQIK